MPIKANEIDSNEGSSGGGYTPGGTTSQILLGNGSASSSLPANIVSDGDVSGLASVAGKIAKSVATAKGDLLVATASATIARQGIGTNGQVLTADSAQTNGLKWADLAASTAYKLQAQLQSGQTLTTSFPTCLYQTATSNNCFTYSSGTWTCTVAGTYLIGAAMYYNSGPIGQLAIFKNGSAFRYGTACEFYYVPTILALVELGVGDTFAIKGYAATNTAPDVTNIYNSYLWAVRQN